ncbi:MAG TPA: NADP-dependent oxidoreductase [Woeseiaceae bacterium]|nr:NADP-dependent oxidoreductase [Woeseiaceae bacterium]
MAAAMNRQVRLASRPSGWVAEANFELAEAPLPEVPEGGLLVRNVYLSLDPYMRGRMNDTKSYVPPFRVGEVLQGGVVGQVVDSRNPGFAAGDWINGMLGWEQYSLSNGQGLYKLPAIEAPRSYHLGVLGMPGMTAWVGLFEIGKARKGETVFVSAASGAVGSIAGQLAKLHGCRVAGCAGSEEKVALMKSEFGFDAGFNYRSSLSLPKSIAEVCPKGIDVNFENVGGEIFEAALWNMRAYGRIALCGMVANYNDERAEPGPRGMMSVIGKRLTIRGFIVTDHPDACKQYVAKAAQWLAEGKLNYRENVVQGLENAPTAFIDMLKGNKVGKQVVQVAGESG